MVSFVAKTLDTHYDEESSSLFLFSEFDGKHKRVVIIPSDSFHKTVDSKQVPVDHDDMKVLAETWKSKFWKIEIQDDPNSDKRVNSPEDFFDFEKVAIGEIGAKMCQIGEELESDSWKISRKMQKLIEQERKRNGS